MPSDRSKINSALGKLDGYVVADGCGSTVTDGWSEIITYAELELDEPSRDFPCAFWTEGAAEECFDAKGALIAPLHLHWRGDRKKIAQALAGVGLTTEVPKNDEGTFTLKPKKATIAAGDWVAIAASELRPGDKVRDKTGIGTVSAVMPSGDELKIFVERGGGFATWYLAKSKKVEMKPRPRDKSGNVRVRAEGLRAGDRVMRDGEPALVTKVKDAKGLVEITLEKPHKALRLRGAEEVVIQADHTLSSTSKVSKEFRTEKVNLRDLRPGDVIVEGAKKRTVVETFMKAGGLQLTTKPGGTKKVSFADQARVVLPRPPDPFEEVPAKQIVKGDQVHLFGRVMNVAAVGRSKIEITFTGKNTYTYAPSSLLRRRPKVSARR